MLGSPAGILLAGVPAMARTFMTSTGLNAAVPAVAQKTSSGGLAAMFGFGSNRIDVPLSEPLPSLPPLKGSVPNTPPSMQAGSLDAGTKVLAIDNVSPVSSISLVFEAGPAHESPAHLGASRVLEAMAFKASKNRTTFRLTRELEKIGAIRSGNAGRDHFAVNISAVRMHVPEVLEILLDSVFNARLNYWEVSEALPAAQAALRSELRDPKNMVIDALHRAAFEGGLGQPMHVDPALLDGITNDTLKEYLAAHLHPSRVVIAAAGVGLSEFKQLANPLVSSESSGNPASQPSTNSQYLGGSLNVVAPTSPLTYVGVAFEAKGGLSNAKSAAAAAVVKELLDEGRAVLPRTSKEHDVFRTASSFSNLYKDTGLVGMLAAGAPTQSAALVDAVIKKVEAVAKGVTDGQLKMGKQLAIGRHAAHMATATGMTAISAPILLYTGKFDPADFARSVESLTAKDISNFVAEGLKATPTFVSYGSMSARPPRFESIAKRLAA